MERQQPEPARDGPREIPGARSGSGRPSSGGTIVKQLQRLGASCDWSRERFTMDEGLSRAVIKVFVELYREGPDLQGQAAGQLGPEAADGDHRSRSRAGRGQGPSLVHPLSDRGQTSARRSASFIVVATTRPETMLGDTGVAVHPDDERYKASGRQACDPAAGRPPDSDRRRRIFRSGEGLRRGQDHAGARLQRFRGRQASQLAAISIFDQEGCMALVGNEDYLRGCPRAR